jgi:oligosaccharide reducing-end xylanase
MAGASAGGTTGAAGIIGPGDAGTTGAAGTTGSAGIGGAAGTSSGAGTTGTAGTGAGGASGVTGTSGRGGSAGGTAGASGRGGAAGGTAGSTAGASGRGGAAGSSTAGTTGSGGARGDCTPPASYANLFVTVSGHTQAESDAKVASAWSSLFNPSGSGTIYFNGPGSNESYVQDIYNNDVRTEGMSYGMTVAVQLDHQTEFDRLWTWVKTHMAQGTTGEIRWKCSTSGSGCAGGGAPDGEEYFATALIFASHRWGDSTGPAKIAYSTEAKWVLDLIRTKYFNSQYHLIKFGSGSNNVDPSYVLPAFYEVWACFDTANADFWKESATAGRAYMQKVVDSNGVCPYQASLTATNPQAANADSTRCPVNLMMDWYLFGKDPWQRDTYAPKFGAYSSSRNNGAPAVGCNSTLGFGLPSSSGKAFVDKLWSTGVPSRDYWGGVLYMLGMVHVSGNFRIW